APPHQPERRGKIERFLRSCREQFLNNLDRKQTLSLEELNERLWAWLDVYHRTEHSSLGTTPLLRWQRDIERIRQLPPATDFRRLFFHRLDRVVRRDCTFLLQNRFAPPCARAWSGERRTTRQAEAAKVRNVSMPGTRLAATLPSPRSWPRGGNPACFGSRFPRPGPGR